MGRLSNPRDKPRARSFLFNILPPDAGLRHFITKWASITLTERVCTGPKRIAGIASPGRPFAVQLIRLQGRDAEHETQGRAMRAFAGRPFPTRQACARLGRDVRL
jgi:hypothetical protein